MLIDENRVVININFRVTDGDVFKMMMTRAKSKDAGELSRCLYKNILLVLIRVANDKRDQVLIFVDLIFS